MLRREVLIISIILSMLVLYNFINQDDASIVGETVLDGWSTISFPVSISIIANPPGVIIDDPKNKTYLILDGGNGFNISLNFVVSHPTSEIDTIWYSLNDRENITITGNLTFNASSPDIYFIRLFVNDTKGSLNDTEYVSFLVGFNAQEENEDLDRDGEIEFDDPTISDLIEKISGLPIGSKVTAINYNYTRPSNWTAPSSDSVESVFRYFEVYVNESTVGGSFTIRFNLTTEDLGSIDAEDIRLYIYETSSWNELTTTVEDSSSNPVSFSAVTTHFSQFLVGEKATSSPAPTGRSISESIRPKSGGKISSFEIDQNFIRVLLKTGGILKKSIEIENTGENDLIIAIEPSESIKDILWIPEPTIILGKNEKKIYDLNFIVKKGVAPGVYIGQIFLKANEELIKKIDVVIEIESEKVFFDISLDIPLKYQTVSPGSELILQSTLLSLGGLSDVEVTIEYQIRNYEGDLILKEEEKISIGTQASFSKKFILPDNLKLGEYLIIAIVKYEDSVGTSSKTFKVEVKEKSFKVGVEERSLLENIFAFSNIIILIILISFVSYLFFIQNKKLKNITKNKKRGIKKIYVKEKKQSSLKEKLGKKLFVLKKSYDDGFIKEETYLKAKEKIEKFLKKK